MDNEDNKINLEKDSDPQDNKPQASTPPPLPSNDEEWAERLHLDFDPKEAEERAKKVTPPPAPSTPPSQPAAPFPPQGAPQAPQFTNPAPFNAAQAPSDQENPVMPPTFMLWSVLALIFCCMPTAIVAIIYSAQVSSKFYARNYEGAKRASERAEMWIIASVVLGVVSMALYLPLSLLTP